MTPAVVTTSVRTWRPSATTAWDAAPRAQQVDAERRVHEREPGRDRDAEVHASQRRAAHEVERRAVEDREGRDGDQRALDARGEELDLAVAVGVVAVRRARGHVHRVEEQRRRDDVDDRLHRVGEERRRAGEAERGELAGADRRSEHERHPAGSQPRRVGDHRSRGVRAAGDGRRRRSRAHARESRARLAPCRRRRRFLPSS
jgi:hypothetical protein